MVKYRLLLKESLVDPEPWYKIPIVLLALTLIGSFFPRLKPVKRFNIFKRLTTGIWLFLVGLTSFTAFAQGILDEKTKEKVDNLVSQYSLEVRRKGEAEHRKEVIGEVREVIKGASASESPSRLDLGYVVHRIPSVRTDPVAKATSSYLNDVSFDISAKAPTEAPEQPGMQGLFGRPEGPKAPQDIRQAEVKIESLHEATLSVEKEVTELEEGCKSTFSDLFTSAFGHDLPEVGKTYLGNLIDEFASRIDLEAAKNSIRQFARKVFTPIKYAKEQVGEKLTKARTAANEGRWTDSADSFNDAFGENKIAFEDPSLSRQAKRANFRAGESQFNAGNDESAKDYFQKVEERWPDSAEAKLSKSRLAEIESRKAPVEVPSADFHLGSPEAQGSSGREGMAKVTISNGCPGELTFSMNGSTHTMPFGGSATFYAPVGTYPVSAVAVLADTTATGSGVWVLKESYYPVSLHVVQGKSGNLGHGEPGGGKSKNPFDLEVPDLFKKRYPRGGLP